MKVNIRLSFKLAILLLLVVTYQSTAGDCNTMVKDFKSRFSNLASDYNKYTKTRSKASRWVVLTNATALRGQYKALKKSCSLNYKTHFSKIVPAFLHYYTGQVLLNDPKTMEEGFAWHRKVMTYLGHQPDSLIYPTYLTNNKKYHVFFRMFQRSIFANCLSYLVNKKHAFAKRCVLGLQRHKARMYHQLDKPTRSDLDQILKVLETNMRIPPTRIPSRP